jgi:hypothetical protein
LFFFKSISGQKQCLLLITAFISLSSFIVITGYAKTNQYAPANTSGFSSSQAKSQGAAASSKSYTNNSSYTYINNSSRNTDTPVAASRPTTVENINPPAQARANALSPVGGSARLSPTSQLVAMADDPLDSPPDIEEAIKNLQTPTDTQRRPAGQNTPDSATAGSPAGNASTATRTTTQPTTAPSAATAKPAVSVSASAPAQENKWVPVNTKVLITTEELAQARQQILNDYKTKYATNAVARFFWRTYENKITLRGVSYNFELEQSKSPLTIGSMSRMFAEGDYDHRVGRYLTHGMRLDADGYIVWYKRDNETWKRMPYESE